MGNSIAIVVRTRDHAACIGETLRRLHEQSGLKDLVSEIVYIDLGSKDGTIGVIKQFQPEKLVQLEPGRFEGGRALNMGMRETSADWVIFLSGDACPAAEHWLEQLVGEMRVHSGAAAVVSMQKPRPGCKDVFAHDQLERFSRGRSQQLGGHHSIAATAIRREVWDREPFRDDLPVSQMEEWASRVESLGWRVLLAEKATVLHSRNYTISEAYQRAYMQAVAWSIVTGRSVPLRTGGRWRGRTLRSVANTCWFDLKYSFEHGNVLQWPFSIAIRVAQYLGERRGYTVGGTAEAKSPQGPVPHPLTGLQPRQ